MFEHFLRVRILFQLGEYVHDFLSVSLVLFLVHPLCRVQT